MDANRIEDIGHQIKGRLKEKFGRLIGDAKLTADGAAERAMGDARAMASVKVVAGIDADRIGGVGHQIKGAGERVFGRLLGDAELMAKGNAEISAGRAQNEAGSARDAAREAERAARIAADQATTFAPKHDAPEHAAPEHNAPVHAGPEA